MQLNPQHLTIANLLKGRLFRIPDYQRAYSWGSKQRKDLFDDILEVYSSGRDHFMATVVTLSGDKRNIGAEEFQTVDIVDGQQRITTLIILLKTIENELKNENSLMSKTKDDLSNLLIKGDEHSLVLLQTNHDSSNIFSSYLRNSIVNSEKVTTASDKNLIDAIIDCKKFVLEWNDISNGKLLDLLSTIYNKLSLVYHQIGDESIVYRVFEVLNSRGLDVKWIDKTKSQMMALVYDHVETDSKIIAVNELKVIWQGIFRLLGLNNKLGDETLRFAGTWSNKVMPSKILSEELASVELLSRAGTNYKTIIESANWLSNVVEAEKKLLADVRRSAASEIIQARFVAVAIILRNFGSKIENELLTIWEKIAFRIYGLGSGDGRTKVGDFVRLGYKIINDNLDDKVISEGLHLIGNSYKISDILEEWDDNAYEGWQKNLRYLLYRYDEFLAKESGEAINDMVWQKNLERGRLKIY